MWRVRRELTMFVLLSWLSTGYIGYAQETQQGNVYYDSALGIFIKKPDGWIMVVGDELQGLITTEPGKDLVAFFRFPPEEIEQGMIVVNPFQNPQATVHVQPWAVSPSGLLDSVAKSFAKAEDVASGTKLTEPPRVVQVNGKAWVRVVTESQVRGKEQGVLKGVHVEVPFEAVVTLRSESYFYNKGDQLISVQLLCPSYEVDRYRAAFDQIVQSLQVDGAPEI